ncbi:hypothetical protein [Nocardia sp. NPDC046763]|uniref:hypothetical protein n=1 Tax=Nocardia sp. NPDC046763 TaxID=3155256 RepID=UPI00340DF053
MGRQTEDGRHEGYVAFVFADGMSGGSYSAGTAIATKGPDGKQLDYADWQHRPEAEVIGWRATCSDCSGMTTRGSTHWQGPLWKRAQTPAAQNLDELRIYSDKARLPEEIEDLILDAWEEHIAPTLGTYPVELAANEVAEAQTRLTEAVLAARAQGASWDAIGKAAGMTRQSAHERWSRLTR